MTASATAPGASPALAGLATTVQSAVVAAGFACAARARVAGFSHVECPKAGVADIDIYARADGTVAGVDAYAPGTPMTADAMLSVLGPALDASAGTGGWASVAAAVRDAGYPPTQTVTVLAPGGLSVTVHGFANGGLASVAVLAPDLAAVWGHPPVPSTTPRPTANP